jgi:hypothetical protein
MRFENGGYQMGDIVKLIKEVLVASLLIAMFSALIQSGLSGLVFNNQSLPNTTPDLSYQGRYYMTGAGPGGSNLVIGYPLYVVYSNLGYIVGIGLFLAMLGICLKTWK